MSGNGYVKAYSVTLFCLGLLLLLGSLQFLVSDGGTGSPQRFVSSLLLLGGFACLVVALLRWMKASAALPATVALSFLLLLAFPFGTVVSIYWLTSVRPKEPTPRDNLHRAWFQYTVALYIFGLFLLDGVLIIRYVLASSPGDGSAFEWLEWGMLAMALAIFLIASLRAAKPRWGYWATFIFSILILLWFPLGTGFALVWFLAVRRHEKEILDRERSQAAAYGPIFE